MAAIDARMHAVYWGEYLASDGLMKLHDDELVISPEQVPLAKKLNWVGAGSGWAAYTDQLKQRIQHPINSIFEHVYPQSASIAKLAVHDFALGKAVDATHAVPVYLRNDVAKKTFEQGR